jgi:2-phospho-L-lactate/phosphoenolpyruvate guanylyltransferase
MSDFNTWAVIPVKRFAAAKARLAPVLDATERTVLARLMFEDVLDGVVQCNGVLSGTLVVTSDEEAAAVAGQRGAKVIGDSEESGINAAITRVAQHVQEHDGIIVVPSDIPQLSPLAIAMAARAIAAERTLALVAAAQDGGTNLLACRPITAMPLCFGAQSFDRHCRAAMQAGLAVQQMDCRELALDIDRPEDLGQFLKLDSRTRTHTFLSKLGIGERLERCLPLGGAPELTASGVRHAG